jgi:hypothetical protein
MGNSGVFELIKQEIFTAKEWLGCTIHDARAYRKRGLGRHLKASSTIQLIRHHPSLRFIVTDIGLKAQRKGLSRARPQTQVRIRNSEFI